MKHPQAARLAAIRALTPKSPAANARGFFSERPATEWQDALATGNGIQGALVYGQPLDETIILNHARLFLPLHAPLPPVDTARHLPEIRRMLMAGQYAEASKFVVNLSQTEGYGDKRWTDPYVPACDLLVRMATSGPARDYRRTVDFLTGAVTVSWTGDEGTFARRLFVSRASDVVVLLIEGPRAGALSCELSLAARPTSGQGGWNPEKMFAEGVRSTSASAGPGWLGHETTFKREWPGSLKGCDVFARVIPVGGSSRVVGSGLQIDNADRVLVILRTAPRSEGMPPGPDALRAALDALPADFDTLLAAHAAIHRKLYDRVRLDLGGDPGDRALSSEELIAKGASVPFLPALLERQFDAARFNILCSSGELFPNLQGIWTGTWSPPWSGTFTANGNLQIALSAALSSNMAECLEPYLRFHEAHLAQFRENARRLYGARGIYVPMQMSTHGLANHFDATWPMTFWTAGAAWAAQAFYDAYLYSGDIGFLYDCAYPFMREAAAFYEDFVIPGPDGKLLFNPSYSPENHAANTGEQAAVNATMDLSACRELLENCIAAATTLDRDADRVARWRALLPKLPAYYINEAGAVNEWATPVLEDNDAHRHCSHLYALYNGLAPHVEADPALRTAFAAALDRRMAVRREEAKGRSLNGRPPGEMAFGLVLLGFASASLRDATTTGEIMGWLTKGYWRRNFITNHNVGDVFNTDLSGGFPALLLRMLVDSRPGRLDLLPALPAGFPAGRVEGVRARGQVEVRSLSWDATCATAILLSPIDQSLTIRGPDGLSHPLDLVAGRESSITVCRP